MKVLVIDDEPSTLAMFKLFLAAYGHEVITAETGEQGMEIFVSRNPDIVFTDIRMPGMGGLEVLRQIRASGSDCQVIIITGHGDLDQAKAALDLSASDFINKPVERTALTTALERAEKRLFQAGPNPFSITTQPEGQCLKLVLGGRLNQAAAPLLSGIQIETAPEKTVRLLFKDDFSMDGNGLDLVLEFLGRTLGSGLDTEITGVSHNHIRLFEMAGMGRLTTLTHECHEETGP